MPVLPKADLPVVAVFNASEDTVDLLTEFFEQQGFRAVGRTWPARKPLTPHAAREFMSQHQPHVVVFDVSLPYEENWERFREFQSLAGERHIPVVLTTTNRDAMLGTRMDRILRARFCAKVSRTQVVFTALRA